MYDFQYLKVFFNVKSIFVWALILIFLKFVFKTFSRNPKCVKFAEQLPGPYAFPVIGNSFDLLIRARNGFSPFFNRYIKAYGRTFRLWIGNQLVVVLSDPEEIQTILNSSSCLGKPDMFTQVTHKFLGDSLAFSEPSKWKQKRRTFQPSFSPNAVLMNLPSINKFTYKYIEEMKALVDGPEFDFTSIANEMSFETLLTTHLNYEADKAKREELLVNVVYGVSSAIEKLSGSMICYWSFLKMIFAVLQPADSRATKRRIYDFIDQILNRQQKSSTFGTRNPMELKNEDHESESVAQSYLNSLRKLAEETNDDQLEYTELTTIIVASIETTAVATAACLLALAIHPDIQEKVYQEIFEVFGDDERPAEKSDIDKLFYLDQVIKETLRLYTLLPVIFREISDATKIGNYIYPAGTAVMICIGGVHHNPEIYPNPDRFNPDNFLPEAVRKRHRFSFLAFSAGARNCIGKSYAETSMKLRLVGFLRTFSFHTTKKLEDIKLKPGFIERSAIGYPVSIKLRKKSS